MWEFILKKVLVSLWPWLTWQSLVYQFGIERSQAKRPFPNSRIIQLLLLERGLFHGVRSKACQGCVYKKMRCSGKIYWSKNKGLPPGVCCLIQDQTAQLCLWGCKACTCPHQAQKNQAPEMQTFSESHFLICCQGCAGAHAAARPTQLLWKESMGMKQTNEWTLVKLWLYFLGFGER